MAISRVKTWIAEVLEFADLNAEFDNIINNALSLISPLTGTLDADGNEIVLDSDGDSSITADTDDRVDVKLSGTDLFRFDGTATTPVNGFDFTASATGSSPALTAFGADAALGVNLVTKGGGRVEIDGIDQAPYDVLANTSASNDASVDITWADRNYRMIIIAFDNLISITDDVDLYFRTSNDAGSTFASTYDYQLNHFQGATVNNEAGTAATEILLTETTAGKGIGNAVGDFYSGVLEIVNPNTTLLKSVVVRAWQQGADGSRASLFVAGNPNVSGGDVDGIRFLMSSGNISSGDFVVWGIR